MNAAQVAESMAASRIGRSLAIHAEHEDRQVRGNKVLYSLLTHQEHAEV